MNRSYALSAPQFPNLVSRVRNIIFHPNLEWPVIAAEPAAPAELYGRYIGPLALIAPVATFIGLSILGINIPLIGTYRVSPVSGIVQAVLSFVLALVGVFIMALIINALAPKFQGEKDSVQALKVAGYASTPAFVAGILSLFPMLAILQMLAALYSLYLLYMGLPVLMNSPKDKALGYTGAIIGCAFLLGLVATAIMVPLHASFLGGTPATFSTLQAP